RDQQGRGRGIDGRLPMRAQEVEPVAHEWLRLVAAERVDVDLEKEAQERLALGSADPAPDVVERTHLGLEEARLVATDLGQDLVDELILAAEVVEEHARARVERAGERAQAQSGKAVREHVFGSPGEGGPA